MPGSTGRRIRRQEASGAPSCRSAMKNGQRNL